MTIDEKLISKLEKLAKLDLSKEEKATLKNDLERILNMVDKLEELDTSGVDPLIYVLEEANVWRADKVQGQVSPAEALKNAPDADDAFFKVPKVINLK